MSENNDSTISRNEKRFAFVIDNGEPTFYDLSKNGDIMNMIDTEDMLNTQDETIQSYLSEIRRLENIEKENLVRLEFLQEENKDFVNKYKSIATGFDKYQVQVAETLQKYYYWYLSNDNLLWQVVKKIADDLNIELKDGSDLE